MPRTKYTKAELKNQMAYGKWIYLAVAAVAVFIAEILFTATQYQAPNARRVDIELVAGYADTTRYEEFMPQLLTAGQAYEKARDEAAGIDTSAAEYELPLQAVEIYNINYSGLNDTEEDYYSGQKYMVMMAAQEGDIYFVNRLELEDLVLSGGAQALDEFIAAGILDPEDRDLEEVTFDEPPEDENTPASGERHIYALQADSMTGMLDAFSYDVRGKYMVMMIYSQNQDTVAAVMQSMMDMFEEE